MVSCIIFVSNLSKISFELDRMKQREKREFFYVSDSYKISLLPLALGAESTPLASSWSMMLAERL